LRCSLKVRRPCIIALGRQAEFFATILVSFGICFGLPGFLNQPARTAIAAHSTGKPELPY
jgi:hypothetical protein